MDAWYVHKDITGRCVVIDNQQYQTDFYISKVNLIDKGLYKFEECLALLTNKCNIGLNFNIYLYVNEDEYDDGESDIAIYVRKLEDELFLIGDDVWRHKHYKITKTNLIEVLKSVIKLCE